MTIGRAPAPSLNVYVFLCLDGLVQAVGVASALHEASRELVDDYDLAVLDHIFAVPPEYGLGLEGGAGSATAT